MLENWNMTTLRQCAEKAASALAEKRCAESGDMDLAKVADVIEQALSTAAQERKESTQQQMIEGKEGEKAAARERLTQLLSASPAVI